MNEINKNLTFREALVAAENFLMELPDQLELKVTNYFSDGLYARELFIPAGTILTGAIHKTKHLCVMHGDIEIESEFGGGRFTGYHMFISEPGVKRIGYAHKDTIFTTLHPTEVTDVEELENTLVCKSYEEYESFLLEVEKQKQLEGTV